MLSGILIALGGFCMGTLLIKATNDSSTVNWVLLTVIGIATVCLVISSSRNEARDKKVIEDLQKNLNTANRIICDLVTHENDRKDG